MFNLTYEDLSSERKEVLNCASDCLLIKGPPGSGKTALAIIKAEQFVGRSLKDYQKVLFLTFSRASVFQIFSRSKHLEQNKIEIDTYHAFFLHLIQQFGKYSGFEPGELFLMKSGERKDIKNSKKNLVDFCKENNRIHFNEFCYFATEILKNSSTIRSSLYKTYPLIIIDEFQDTSDEQWNFIKLLSKGTKLICFAGPGQMIYRYLKANPARLKQLCEWRTTKVYELDNKSFRDTSGYFNKLGKCILDKDYSKIQVNKEGVTLEGIAHFYRKGNLLNYQFGTKLKWTVRRLVEKPRVRVGVFCYQNEDCRRIAEFFSNKTKKADFSIYYDLIESNEKIEEKYYLEDLILDFWNQSLDPSHNIKNSLELFLKYGEKGLLNIEKLKSPEIQAFAIKKETFYFEDFQNLFIENYGIDSAKEELKDKLKDILEFYKSFTSINGNPKPLEFKTSFLGKRAQEATRDKFREPKGVNIMTLHKSKGKEFDFAIIILFERDPFVSYPKNEPDHRELLNVGITRARNKVFIYYPNKEHCRIIKELRKIGF